MQTIAIIDYGMGNLASIANMIKKTGGKCNIVNNAGLLPMYDKVILPGVGAFDTAINNIKINGLWDALNKFALEDKKPVLGICLGMQLLCNQSEEGVEKGFGWIDADVRKLQLNNSSLRTPHMGWNTLHVQNKAFPLFKNTEAEQRFYFVHSYAVACNKQENIAATTNYGGHFHSVIWNHNIMGFQCHPEKSHKFGMQIFKNFIEL
ncbi:imidazole glycerol phosphate synthase subunit HisH [Polluticaenibacter yanchengensis]|uniref:Imidazole glycerol phosphate synthase subunit HisH n=1 Tax=Polluticaenibacter yanchengensis TaxID=3014562 RepID=A0ABT4UIQ4_9BACT|nr:imidazole glycerol phosphate synthase subunit HisH [Chitinophagaceae bacterium LY-5]